MRLNPFVRAAVLAVGIVPIAAFGGPFVQTNLSSNIPGLAVNTDSSLINPWGISFAATSPLWISNQGSLNSTLHNGDGSQLGLVVTIPGAIGPTGQVFNSTSSSTSFVLSNGSKATFLFATLDGTVAGWNGAAGTTALQSFTSTSGGVFTGLALGNNAAGDFLYAADFANAAIQVINSSFGGTSLPGSFTDPGLPSGYAPYNIQNIGGQLYIEYAQIDPITHEAAIGAGLGIVSVFDTSGNFIKRLISNGGALNAPWGVTIAPAGFPQFGGALLVGNFGDGTINAYDPGTGTFLGTITDAANNAIANKGLWGIGFRTGGTGFDPNSLYFVAGINDEADGLFGAIGAAPEPGTFALMSLAFGGLLVARKRFSGKAAAKKSL
jgi:uncharacterized protein (TIGR03118 family)